MKKLLKYFSFALISFQLFFSCSKPIEADLVITNVNIIDVKTGDVHSNMDVIIDGETITSIFEHKNNSNYKSANVIDGTDKFLIPGLWDMHTHTWWGYKDFFPLLLANGVTGIREMFGDLDTIKKIRLEIASGDIIGPMIFSAGDIIDGDPPSISSSDVAKTPEEGRELVRKQKAEGADFIKVYNSLERDVYFAIADECKKQNIMLAGHIPHKITLTEALSVNHSSIEHFFGILDYSSDTKGLFQIDSLRTKRFNYLEHYKRTDYLNKTYNKSKENEVIALLSKSDIWICPTFTVHKGFIRQYDYYYSDDRIDYMPDYAMNDWKWITASDSILSKDNARMLNIDKTWYNLMISLIKPLQTSGAKFLAGSDYANPYTYPGFSLHEELEIFVEEAGLTNLEALQTATINPAIFMGKESEFGTIENGKLANLVLLDKNPLDNINNTRSINSVLISGQYFEGQKLRDNIEEIAKLNRLPKINDVLFKIIQQQDIESAISEYHNLKETQPEAYNFSVSQLNGLGYQLLGIQKIQEAIAIFKLNTDMFPEDGNAYDSLGDAYLANNDTINAIKAYETAVKKGFNVSKPKLESLKNKND